MFYRLLGMIVWNSAKALLRYRYGPTYLPRSVRAGLVLTLAVGAALALARRNGSDS
ncbi:MAG TPA: hypothetical protein VFM58_14525 [Solirubrobacteraceae bacterium]|jgi:hypothetical protein|nr:hypothetical protein [Solirubrobacteraceae bacterium]